MCLGGGGAGVYGIKVGSYSVQLQPMRSLSASGNHFFRPISSKLNSPSALKNRLIRIILSMASPWPSG